jgi:hypothetical protein
LSRSTISIGLLESSNSKEKLNDCLCLECFWKTLNFDDFTN